MFHSLHSLLVVIAILKEVTGCPCNCRSGWFDEIESASAPWNRTVTGATRRASSHTRALGNNLSLSLLPGEEVCGDDVTGWNRWQVLERGSRAERIER